VSELDDASLAELEQRPQWRLAGVICFALLALLLLYAAFKILWPFMTAILLGMILVILTFNLFRRVRMTTKGSSTRAAVVMLLAVTFIIVIPAVILGILLIFATATRKR
jgi:predicted PurR-regulated permease PerM